MGDENQEMIAGEVVQTWREAANTALDRAYYRPLIRPLTLDENEDEDEDEEESRDQWECMCPIHRCGAIIGMDTSEQDAYWVDGIGLVCGHCRTEHYQLCGSCHQWREARYNLGRAQTPICRNCSRHTTIHQCIMCATRFRANDLEWTRGENGACRSCLHSLRNRPPTIRNRRFNIDYDLLSGKKAGKIVKSLRAFGVELEVQWHEIERAAKASEEINTLIGVGRDSSISGNGMEVQTPPARGEKAETMIRKLCGQLLKHKFTIDKSCGMHVHIDVPELSAFPPDAKLTCLQNIWCMYLTFEDVIMSFLPASRRGNSYCQSLKADYHFDEIWKCQTIEQLERLWYRVVNQSQVAAAKQEHRHKSRYRGINFHPLLSELHLEIRYHSGTMISRKILEWANLHCLFMDKCLQVGPHVSRNFFSTDRDNPNGENWLNRSTYGDKTEFFMNFIGLNDESKGYFRARQAEFYEKLTVKEDPHFKEGKRELEIEKEE